MRNEITCYDDKVETVSKKSNEKLLFCEVLNPSIQWFSYDPFSWSFPKCVGIPWDETRCCPPNVWTTTHAPASLPETYPAPNILEWLSYLEHIKEGSPRLRDNLCRHHNNTLQAQMLSGTLAVTLREVVVVCFLRKRFLLYRWEGDQNFCKGKYFYNSTSGRRRVKRKWHWQLPSDLLDSLHVLCWNHSLDVFVTIMNFAFWCLEGGWVLAWLLQSKTKKYHRRWR